MGQNNSQQRFCRLQIYMEEGVKRKQKLENILDGHARNPSRQSSLEDVSHLVLVSSEPLFRTCTDHHTLQDISHTLKESRAL